MSETIVAAVLLGLAIVVGAVIIDHGFTNLANTIGERGYYLEQWGREAFGPFKMEISTEIRHQSIDPGFGVSPSEQVRRYPAGEVRP